MPHNSKILNASWISTDQILILLAFDWCTKDQLPPLYFNSPNDPIQNLKRAPLGLFGKLWGYFIKGDYITFVYHPTEIESSKKIYVAGNFNNWGEAIGREEWLLKPTKIDDDQALALTIPWKNLNDTDIESQFKFVIEDRTWIQIPPEAPNIQFDVHNNSNHQIYSSCTGNNVFIFNPNEHCDPSVINKILWIDEANSESYNIDDTFVLLNLGSNKELGAITSSLGTTFRLFAPRAKSVHVTFSNNQKFTKFTVLELKRNLDYSWETYFSKNLHGYYYYYSILGGEKDPSSNCRVLDPYALATVGPGGPGIIIDRKELPKLESTFKTPLWQDIVIIEGHLKDLINNTPFGKQFQEPVGFRNLTKWIESKNNYIKTLGINAIELLPIQEYERESVFEYHWGYMPTSYFCPSSSYASEGGGLAQIVEFQELVDAFHKAGISVILDVVYNHSGSPNHLLHIDKDYYFEVTKNGALMNWSGCGNDFRASTPMGKRLIIDSLVYLIETYDVDGFRFDLAELLGVEVLMEIESALKVIKPSIVLIAEPWSFRGHIGHALRSTGFASWNDDYREFIATYVQSGSNLDAFSYFITGSTSYLARFTAQSVNYSASHDDYCWLDRITENADHDGSYPTLHDIRRTHLMVAILMMSVGIPMLAEGQDLLHSKRGHRNTYRDEDLNALNYMNTANYSNTHQYFSRWIHFRLSENGQAIRIANMPSKGYFKFYKHEEQTAIGVLYNADQSLKDVSQLLFAVNPGLKQVELSLPDLNPKVFLQIGDQERFNAYGLEDALIPWTKNMLILPPLGCGLWIGPKKEKGT